MQSDESNNTPDNPSSNDADSTITDTADSSSSSNTNESNSVVQSDNGNSSTPKNSETVSLGPTFSSQGNIASDGKSGGAKGDGGYPEKVFF